MKALWLSYAALMALLALTYGLAFVDLGRFHLAAAMLVAIVKAGIVLVIFMELREAASVARLFAGTGFAWLALLLTLTFADYMTR